MYDFLSAFIVSVLAGIIANVICKWFDGDD